MERRLVLAIALSLLVLLSWSALVQKTYHVENKGVTAQPLISKTQPSQPSSFQQKEEEFPESALFNYASDRLEITFIEAQAAVKDITFKAYQDYKFPLKYGFLLADKALIFKKESTSSDTVTFVYKDQNKKIIKRFIFSKANYCIGLELNVQNLSDTLLKLNLPLVLGVLDFSRQNTRARFQDVTVATKEKTLHLAARKNLEFPDLKFLSLRDRYFCGIIQPEKDKFTGFIKKINGELEIGLSSQELVLAPGEQIGQKFQIYLGPQDLKLINSARPEWSAVIYYGVFDFISQLLLQLLEFLYRLVHNWGWAIVILSFIVYILAFPLSLKQMRSMKEMQVLQPQIEELRKKYKDNPEKLNKEIMQLYRQHKVNPFGGCLPLILQMPIFLALYQALMRSVALKGAHFLWIKDLSEPDRLFTLPISLPVLGNEINILPILMTVGMFIQQKISTKAASGSTQEQQKMMMILFPLMFGIIFYHMPAGLVLYWFINSSLMLIYQIRISQAK